MPRKCVEFFLRVVDLAGGRKSTAPFFRLSGASLSPEEELHDYGVSGYSAFVNFR